MSVRFFVHGSVQEMSTETSRSGTGITHVLTGDDARVSITAHPTVEDFIEAALSSGAEVTTITIEESRYSSRRVVPVFRLDLGSTMNVTFFGPNLLVDFPLRDKVQDLLAVKA